MWEKPAELSLLEEGKEDTPSAKTEPLPGEEETLTERVSGAEEAKDSRVLQVAKFRFGRMGVVIPCHLHLSCAVLPLWCLIADRYIEKWHLLNNLKLSKHVVSHYDEKMTMLTIISMFSDNNADKEEDYDYDEDDDNDDKIIPLEDEEEEGTPAKKARKTSLCAKREQPEEEQDPK